VQWKIDCYILSVLFDSSLLFSLDLSSQFLFLGRAIRSRCVFCPSLFERVESRQGIFHVFCWLFAEHSWSNRFPWQGFAFSVPLVFQARVFICRSQKFSSAPDFSSPCSRQVSGSESQALISNAGLCSMINFAGSSSLMVQTAGSVFLLLFFSPTEVHSGQQQGFDFIFREQPWPDLLSVWISLLRSSVRCCWFCGLRACSLDLIFPCLFSAQGSESAPLVRGRLLCIPLWS
jgi:hypothetical protein